MPDSPLETLSGLVERVTFHNTDSGFAVLKTKVKGQRELVTVIGTVSYVAAGEHFEAAGRWRIDRDHGRQFKAEQLRTIPPTTEEGIERYLGSGAIRSIGKKLAHKIVSVHHQHTLEIIERAPDLLRHIRGVGPKRIERIRASWQEQKAVRELMLFLHSHGGQFQPSGEDSSNLRRAGPGGPQDQSLPCCRAAQLRLLMLVAQIVR